jgi:phosphoenolpyruvate-protein phosphotransferase (PTS system enzyme I)
MIRFVGVGVSPGRAAGPVVRVPDPLPEPAGLPAPTDPAAEAGRIAVAARRVAERLRAGAGAATGEAKAILETTVLLAEDPALLSEAERLVMAAGLPAPRAVHRAAATFVDRLRAAGGYLAERARDVQDIRDRLVAELLGVAPPGIPPLDRPSVLIARDLAPVDTASLPAAQVLALVTEEGGPTSHTAILARSLGVPAVVACRGILAAAPDAVIVDGESGVVQVPDGPVAAVAAGRSPEAVSVAWRGPGATRDGHAVSVLANVGSAAEAGAALAAGADGIGLFRTEFCYLAAPVEPSVDAQRVAYAEVLRPFHGKPAIVRTLDAGADKQLPFLTAEPEPNPALGVRGVRLSRARVGMLDRQLAAIDGAAADSGAAVSVMAPMVSTVDEASWFAERARAAGLGRVGVMIEVPAAALAAREIFAAVDFVSLGTNDLAQYLFAADRQLGAVAALNDPWQPALLRLVALIGEAAIAVAKPAGVCGEAAADPDLACVLVGLGVTSLSAHPSSLPRVGARLAAVTTAACRQAAAAALAAPDPAAARAAARGALSD